MKKLCLFISTLIAFLLQASVSHAHKNEEHARSAYIVGIAPQFTIRKIQSIWRPILNQVELLSGIHLTLRGSDTITKFESEYMAGNFDFAYTNPYRMMLAGKTQGYTPLVRDVERLLYGVLVVRKDSPFKNVSELDGKDIAFPAPNAMGASLMVRHDLKKIFNININPVYTQTHNSSYLNVVLGKTAAGGGVQKTFNKQKPVIKDKLRIIHETVKVPPHAFSVHSRVPKDVAKKIQQALLAIGETEEGKKLFSNVPIKKIGVATMEEYKPLLNMGLEEFYVD